MSLAKQPARQDDYERFFAELKSRLAAISHSDEAVNVIESAVSERFKKTAQRQIAFAQPGCICLEPITYEDALADGRITADEDRFFVLQGDVITTESAYFFGERVTGALLFAVLNSTCDLVPGRREYASLLRVHPIVGDGDALKSTLHQLLSFRNRRDLYLPPLPEENPPTLGYSVRFARVLISRTGGAGEATPAKWA